MPAGTKSLLGLGLNYCIKMPLPTNNYNRTIKRFKNDVRRIGYFKFKPPDPKEDPNEVRYIPGLYIKSDHEFGPVEKCEEIEQCLKEFERELTRRQTRFMLKPTASNLTYSQWKLSKRLRCNDNHLVIETDKNLGGCMLNVPVYCVRGIKEHLGNTAVYKPLTKTEVDRRLHTLRFRIFLFAQKWRKAKAITLAEDDYLQEACSKYKDKVARFRMSLKAHKDPWKMRPIVCCVGTFMNCLSKWLDYHLQKLKPFVPTYIKDSNHLLDMLAEIKDIPPNAKLWTSDANSMYTNIDTKHAIEVIGLWLDGLADQLPDDFPLEAVKEAMVLVMENNIFEWGDMYFLQLLGTAMGTSAACMWATIYYAVHESGLLLPKYHRQLMDFLKRFIDDMIGLWVGTDFEWECFKKDADDFGILTWEFDEPSDSVVFLDLTISIKHGRFVTKTYQKALNLYQYIPPTSCHPPWMMKGIIYSLMKNYKRQNTSKKDYHNMAVKLFKRHVARGWDRATMRGYIIDADRRLERPKPTTTQVTPLDLDAKERLFLHLEFHPHDIPRKLVRSIYDYTCKDTFEKYLGIQQFTVAYSRPRNIRDLLTRAKLHQAPGKPISKYYTGELDDS